MTNKEFSLNKVAVYRMNNLRTIECNEKAHALVQYKVFAAQLDALCKSLPLNEFEEAHPGVDFWTASPDLFEGVCENSIIDDVIATRENALTVKKAISELPYGLDAWNALSDTDKCFIIIEAHKTNKSICLDKYLFKSDKGVDLSGIGKAVSDFYKTGKKKPLADCLRTMFYKVAGESGELFNGLSLTRSDWMNSDLVNFAATFGGRAKRQEKKGKDGNVTIGLYDYKNSFSSWKVQSQALTTLLGVVIEARTKTYCQVISR